MSQQREVLQLNVVSCLTAILGEDQDARKAAEEELKALEVTEGAYNYCFCTFHVFITIMNTYTDRVWCDIG